MAISCLETNAGPDLHLKTGLLFGNSVRDCSGQIKAGDFANSQDFNAISRELNQIVEKQVLPQLKSPAAVGKQIRFVGCVEVRSNGKTSGPLQVIPLQVEFP